MTEEKPKAGSDPGLFFVIASEAKQSRDGKESAGLLRRYAPRNDGIDYCAACRESPNTG
jgi:hypothetical protein